MIPVRLELTAFGPFVETQVVDFERLGAHGLFLIHGQTGAGKSSLLDALTFALFGDTSGGDRDGEDMVTSLAAGRKTTVALEFTHGDKRYRVERSPKQERPLKRGTGTTTEQPTAHLYEVGDPLKLLAEGKAAVTREITTLLHCDAKQFRQTVVLPQGQFRQVIEDDGTRRTTLAHLFDTGRFLRLQERLVRYAKHLRTAVAGAEQELQALRDEHEVPDLSGLEAKLSATNADLAAAAAAVKVAEDAYKAAIEAQTAGKRLHDDFLALAGVQSELAEFAARAEDIKVTRERLRDDSRARDVETTVAAWRGAVELDEGRQEAITRCEAELAEAAQLATEAAATAAEHEKRRPEREKADEAARRLKLLEPDLMALAEVTGRRSRAEAALTEAGQQLAALKSEHESLEKQRDENAEALAKTEAALAELGDTGTLLERSNSRLNAARTVYDALKALSEHSSAASGFDLEDLWAPLSTALATRLEPGEPCPVCGSVHHDDGAHGVAPATAVADLEAALRSAQAANLAAAEARAAAAERLRGGLDGGGWASESELPALETLTAEFEAAKAKHATAQELTKSVQTRRTEGQKLGAALSSSAGPLSSAEVERVSAEVNAASAKAAHDTMAARLEPSYREDPASFQRDLNGALATVKSFDAQATELTEAVKRTEQHRAIATEKLNHARKEAQASSEKVQKSLAAAEKALKRHGFTTASGESDPEAQRAALLEPEVREELTDQVKLHDDALTAAKAREQQLLKSTDARSEPDLDALQARVDETTAARAAASGAAEQQRQILDALQRAVGKWQQIESDLGAKRQQHRTAQHIADMADGKTTGEFRLDLETYVLRRILTNVLALANLHLSGMTGGRFQLRLDLEPKELRASGLRLEVEDRHAGGKRRSVKTLSGGEGFQASLALALGLAETAQRTSGAVEIGALFVDEGFGSLDSVTLEEVVTILRRLPGEQRRMVGVITHVEGLKGRIAAQLEVVGGRGDGGGSSVRHVFG